MTDLATRIADARGRAVRSLNIKRQLVPKDFEPQEAHPSLTKDQLIIDMADEINRLTAQVETATIPPGYVLVPEKPTEAMLYEGEGYTDLVMPEGFPNTPEERRNEIACAWSAMIDVALGRGTADRIRARKAARVHEEIAPKPEVELSDDDMRKIRQWASAPAEDDPDWKVTEDALAHTELAEKEKE